MTTPVHLLARIALTTCLCLTLSLFAPTPVRAEAGLSRLLGNVFDHVTFADDPDGAGRTREPETSSCGGVHGCDVPMYELHHGRTYQLSSTLSLVAHYWRTGPTDGRLWMKQRLMVVGCRVELPASMFIGVTAGAAHIKRRASKHQHEDTAESDAVPVVSAGMGVDLSGWGVDADLMVRGMQSIGSSSVDARWGNFVELTLLGEF